MQLIVEQKPDAETEQTANGMTAGRRWSVIAASGVDALAIVKGALGIQIFSVYQNVQGQVPNPNLLLRRLRARGKPEAVIGGLGQYIIDGEYSTDLEDKRAVPGGPWVWSVRGTLGSLLVDHDFKGNPIVTSSEEPVDPPLTRLSPEEVLHGERYFQGPDEISVYIPLRPYVATVNAAPFFGASRGCVLCHVPQPRASDSGWVFVSIDFQYKKPKHLFGQTYEGWQDTIPDRGRRKIKDNTSNDPGQRYEAIPMRGVNGGGLVPVDEPAFLDGHGQPLPNVTNIGQDGGPAPFIKVVTHYDYMDFNNIQGIGGF